MSTNDSNVEPEELIAGLNRKRNLVMMGALVGVLAILGGLFAATAAMYTREATGGVQTTKAALQPAAEEAR